MITKKQKIHHLKTNSRRKLVGKISKLKAFGEDENCLLKVDDKWYLSADWIKTHIAYPSRLCKSVGGGLWGVAYYYDLSIYFDVSRYRNVIAYNKDVNIALCVAIDDVIDFCELVEFASEAKLIEQGLDAVCSEVMGFIENAGVK